MKDVSSDGKRQQGFYLFLINRFMKKLGGKIPLKNGKRKKGKKAHCFE
jgi:sensor histidine kinase regulating citrate/malate metabolism